MLAFFDAEELQDYVDHSPSADELACVLDHVSLSWVREEDVAAVNDTAKSAPSGKVDDVEDGTEEHLLRTEVNRSVHTLNDVTVNVKKGQLVAVVGPVGSGKSSLLNGLLGELILTEGKVRVSGSVGE
jgi:ABC-type glutathione transport system ATPase component